MQGKRCGHQHGIEATGQSFNPNVWILRSYSCGYGLYQTIRAV
jgi:hypothetical protein